MTPDIAVLALLKCLRTKWSGKVLGFLVLLVAAPLALANVDVVVNVTDNIDPIVAGANLTYTVTANNNGTDPTSGGVALSITLPAGAVFVSATPTAGTCNAPAGGVVSCSLGDINSGDTVTIPVIVRPLATPNSVLSATTTTTGDSSTGNNTNISQNTTVNAGADLSLAIVSSNTTPSPGQNYSYTLTASNAGPQSTNTTVTVSNSLPPSGVTYVSASGSGWNCSQSSGTVTCTRSGVIASGASAPDITITVTPTAAGGSVLTNNGTVTLAAGGAVDPTSANNTATATVTVAAGTDMGVSVSASPTNPIHNSSATFTVTPKFLAGTPPGSGSTQTVTIPVDGSKWTSLTGLSGGAYWSCDYGTTTASTITCAHTGAIASPGNLQAITWSATAVNAGASDITDTVTATVAINPETDPNAGNNSASQVVTLRALKADLTLTKTKVSPTGAVAQGGTVSFNIAIKNNGPADSTGTQTLTDTLPVELRDPTASASGTGWSCAQDASYASNGQIVCTRTTAIANGATTNITVTTKAQGSNGTFLNNVGLACSGSCLPPGNPGPASASVVVTMSGNSVDLEVTSVSATPDPVKAGNDLVYTIAVKNNDSSNDAGNVHVTNAVSNYVGTPTATWLINGGSNAGSSGNCSLSSGSFDCSIGTLEHGQTATVTLTVKPSVAGNRTDTANIYSVDVGDPITANNSNSVTTVVTADADVTTSITATGTLKAGTNLTYTLAATNNGPSAANGVTLTSSALPAGVDFVSVASGCSFNSGTRIVSCTVGSLGNGSTQNYSLVVRPRNTGAVALTLTAASNTNAGAGGVADRDLTNQSANRSDTITAPTLDLLINDTDTPDPVPLGNSVVHTIRATNQGPSISSNTVISDTPPAALTVSAVSGGTIYSNSTGCSGTVVGTFSCSGTSSISCAVGDLDAGQSACFNITMTTPTAGVYTNNASVSSTEILAGQDTNATNNTVAENTTFKQGADLSLTKLVDRANANIGDHVVFTVTALNSGPGNATGVTVQDSLPAGLSYVSSSATRGSYNSGSGVWTIGNLDNGQNAILTLTAAAGSNGVKVNTAEITASSLPDPDSTPNNHVASEDDQASASVTVTAVTLGSIAGKVYLDKDNNGSFGGSDSAIAGVTLNLTGYSFGANGTDDNGSGDDLAVTATTTTDTSGNYSFPGLLAGKYTVTEPNQPANTGNGITTAGSNGGTATTTAVAPSVISGIVINTAPGFTSTGNDFAEVDGSLQGYVYVDANNNGAKDGGETPINGITIKLTGYSFGANGTDDSGSGDDQTVSTTTTTNASGFFSFPIQPGVYSLEEIQDSVLRTSYTDGKETAGVAGGTVTNTAFGNNPGYNKIQNITVTAANLSSNNGIIGGNLFGERTLVATSLIPPVVSGYVYVDANHDRSRPPAIADSRVTGWTVTLTATRSDSSSEVICAVKTDSVGYYHLDNLSCLQDYPQWSGGLPTTGTAVTGGGGVTYQSFSLSFSNPGEGGITTSPQSGGGAGVVSTATGRIQSITLNPGDSIVEQNLPLDPSGVVYDAVTRAPVSGAVVRLLEGGVPVPTACLVSNQNPVTTGNNGYYEFLLQLGGGCGMAAGVHTFVLDVTPPAGYAPGVSTMLPVAAANYVPTVGGVDPIQVQALPPSGAQSTRYYLNLTLTLTGVVATSSSNVVNNHIPIDPVKTSLIYIAKTTPMLNVSRGDLVPYTVTAINSQGAVLANIDVVDRIPPGFRYRSGSATLNGHPTEPTVAGRDLTWANQTFSANEKKVWKMILVVGSGVGDGEYLNQVWALNHLTGGLDSNVAGATVRVIPDPTFDCSDIIGKVFDDKNANGYQDQGEPGIANVRLATPRGLLVTSDSEGRFHITCADIPQQDRGSNFVMKVDERTLPSGYRLTTDNPGDVRVTRGKMAKLNFGATVHRVVRLELNATAFAADSVDLLPAWASQLKALPTQLLGRPSVLRIAYSGGNGDGLGVPRLEAVAAKVKELWAGLNEGGEERKHYPLVIETELEGAK